MPAVVCLDPSTFQLLEGRLAADEVEHLAPHLERCGRCSRLVQGLAPERLVALMRRVESLPPQSDESSRLKTLLQKMLNVRGNVETLDQLSLVSQTKGGATTPPQSGPSQGPSSPFIGRYRLLRELGRGGMGTVFEAEDAELRRRVALKVPHFNGPAEHQKQMRQRFLREARSAAAVEHPYVCKIHDVGEHNGTPYVVMAYIEGPSLAGRLAKVRRVNDRAAVTLTLRIAEALLAVHAKGIIHRDLKPGNILLPKDNTPILTDFGLAHVHTESGQLTGEGALLGTPAYMAPEQAVSELGPVTIRTDLYSLGVVLFQMLTGRLPVEGDTMQILAHHVARKSAPHLSQLRPEIDPILNAIVGKAMAVRPEDRYANVGDFSQALKDWLKTAAARPDAAGVSVAQSFGNAAETMSPLAAPYSATMAQPAVVPVAHTATVPEHTTVVAPPQPSTMTAPPAALPTPLPVKPAFRWIWGASAAALLLLGGVGVGIIISRDKPNQEVKRDKPPDGGLVEPEKDKDKKLKDDVLLIDEDFSKPFREGKSLPEGWKGDAYRIDKIQNKENLVIATPGTHWVTLPPMNLSGNFRIEGAYSISPYDTVTLQLEDRKSAATLPIVFHYAGSIDIAKSHRNAPANFKPQPPTRFLVSRESNRLMVKLNGSIVVEMDLTEVSNYDKVSLNLYYYSPGYYAKLSHLKITDLSR